jgi:trans-aconitate methyltransferase
MNITDRLPDPKSMFSAYPEFLSPMLHLQQETLQVAERLARYQFAVAGDCLEWSLAMTKNSLATSAPANWFAKHTELGTKFNDQLRSRSQELVTIANESQAALTEAVTGTAASVQAVFTKAA